MGGTCKAHGGRMEITWKAARLQSDSVVTTVHHLASPCCALPLQASACTRAHHAIIGVGKPQCAGMLWLVNVQITSQCEEAMQAARAVPPH